MLSTVHRHCLLAAALVVCAWEAWARNPSEQQSSGEASPATTANCEEKSAGEGATSPKPQFPGQTDDGYLLPNGWRLTPVGRQVELTDLPLNIIPLADNRGALVATGGYNAHLLTLIDLTTGEKLAEQEQRETWFGLALASQTGDLWWSGGGAGVVHRHRLNAKGFVAPEIAGPIETAAGFKSGIFLDEPRKTLYSLTILHKGGNKSLAWGDAVERDEEGGSISAVPLDGDKAMIAPCGLRPYDVVRARNDLLYVSDWAARRVLVVDPAGLRTIARIPVGEHPNQLALHPTDDRLFVACASSNSVSVVDTRTGTVQETIFTSLFPLAPEGSTPDALCVSPDGKTLYVANADNNCVAVIDISLPRRSQVQGFIPTGWYPTAVAATPDGKRVLVGVGKGNQTASNKPPEAAMRELPEQRGEGGYRRIPFQHVGTRLSGALSIVDLPDDEENLQQLTDRVYKNCPYSDKLISGTPYPRKTAVPTKIGDPSPIEHVIYIIKENRTYDQVFSDIERGRGDPSLLMFGRQVTPNHHKLAEEFVLLDNLYCNGHVSADGHPWSTMAYNTDYIARNWCLTYSKRQGIDDDDDGDLSNAPSGYIWDACARHGKTYRSYGEYGGRVSQPDGTFRMEGRVPGLVGHVCPTYGIPKFKGQKVRDTDCVETFLEEFREFEKNGDLPNFIVMSLGEDHTEGTKVGSPTPQACVASNDLALGRLVDVVSRSKYWPKIAIFVIEDDAQNGPDHVDAHRTIGLVISPYVRRKHLDSTQYGTVSMLRTMELILGLPPLSQFDAAATPMFESFTDKPNLTPYEHLPAQIDLAAVNLASAYGSERSGKMDFSEYDKIDDFELNEILWKAIKGVDAPQPPSVRRAIAYRGELED